MDKLIKRILIFIIPLIIIFALPTLILLIGGELTYNKSIFVKEKYIFGIAYSNPVDEFKFSVLKQLQPEVLALGSSRMAQFKKYFMKENVSFYNGSSLIGKIWNVKKLFAKYEKPYPKVIIFGLDPWWFNSNYYYIGTTEHYIQQGIGTFTINPLLIIRNEYFAIFKDYVVQHKFNIRQLIKNKKYNGYKLIGISAKVSHFGFLDDGSYMYTHIIKERRNNRYRKPDFITAIDKMIADEYKIFMYGDKISERALQDLNDFLLFCHRNDIQVVGFLTPFPREVYQRLIESGKYTYLNNLNSALARIFYKNNYRYYDFTLMDKYGVKDEQFIDVNHGSETVYLKLWNLILKDNMAMRSYADIQQLSKLYDNRYSPLEIFENKF